MALAMLSTLTATVERELGAAAGSVAARLAFGLGAGLLGLFASGFALVSLTVLMADAWGLAAACAVTAAGCLLLALILVGMGRLRKRRRTRELARLRIERQAALRGLAASTALGIFGGGGIMRALAPLAVAAALGFVLERRRHH